MRNNEEAPSSRPDDPEAKPPTKRGRKPREKGCPQRPLSAYNLFFREERKRILGAIDRDEPPEDFKGNLAASLKRMEGTKRAGAAKFQAIARTIASRWSALSDSEKAPYQELAKEEMERYKVKKDEYQRKVAAQAVQQGKEGSSAQHLSEGLSGNPTMAYALPAAFAGSGSHPAGGLAQMIRGGAFQLDLPMSMQQHSPTPFGGFAFPGVSFQGQIPQGNSNGLVDSAVLLSLRAEEQRRQEAALLQAALQDREAHIKRLMVLQHQAYPTALAPNADLRLHAQISRQSEQQQQQQHHLLMQRIAREQQLQVQMALQQQQAQRQLSEASLDSKLQPKTPQSRQQGDDGSGFPSPLP